MTGSDDVGADDSAVVPSAAFMPSAETRGAFKACNSARVVSVGIPRFASKKASHHL